MRLTRNITPDGKCKYALVRLDKLREMEPHLAAAEALYALEKLNLIEYGEPGSEEEHFTIKLKDINAPKALLAYADAAAATDKELSDDVRELVDRAVCHPNSHLPD